jgi:orotidine-5'-phosphate decarboxylase
MTCNLILALDVETKEEGLALLQRIGPSLKTVKIGLQLFTRYGPTLVEEVAALGYEVFLDLKLHDIPNTVAKAVQSLSALPISMLTLHASGGAEMMAGADKIRQALKPNLTLLAVTVLTSMNQRALAETGVAASPESQVAVLAKLAQSSGLAGIVCSPLEIGLLRRELGPEAILVTPGIRPADSSADEQKRIMTPTQAATLGANHIVVGRPILQAPDPQAAVARILSEISG